MSIKAEDNIMLESQKPIYDIAADTDQYFWHTSTGTDTGTHITEIPQEDFIDDPTNGGGNLLARSNGITVRDGLEELSRFESAGVQIGADNLPHSVFTANALEFFKNASDKVAQFGTNIIRIGMDSVSTTIKFCKDLIQFKTETYVSPTPNPQYGSNGIRSVLGVDLKDSTEYDGVALDTTAKFKKKYERLNSGGQIIDASTYSGTRASAGTFNASTQMLSEYEETNEATNEYEKKTLSVFNNTSLSENLMQIKAYMEHRNSNNETVGGNASIQISAHGSVQGHISAIGIGADSIWFTPQREFVSTMALQVVSDRNLKEHVSYLDKDAIDFVRELKPVCYIKDGGNHVGFYAQDVEAVDKWDCMTSESDGIKTLGYTELIAPLVAYCQHLEDRIRKLEEK